MGSYNFTWAHPADEVWVTGTFDDWKKTVKLDKKDTVHEKLVNLPTGSGKIFYKFVADGSWSYDHTAKTEADHDGNLNNVLYSDDLGPVNSMAHNLSSVAPGSTTAQLAGQQPLEKDRSSEAPGAFPETPAADKSDDKKELGTGAAAAGGLAGVGALAAGASALGSKKEEDQTFSVNPIPASEGTGNPVSLKPGEPVPNPSTINQNTISSTVRDDPSLKSSATDSEQTFGVAPIPATGGIGNPVSLKPGEKVPEPSSVTANTLNSNVKLDKESYEKSDSGAPILPPVVAGKENLAVGEGLLGPGPQASSIIPESSLGMGKDAPGPMEGAVVNSVGANSTTNQLAGQVPKEPRGVPEVVSESQKEAGVAPEASANSEAVQEKKEMESELKKKVPEEESSDKGASNAGVAGGVAAGLAFAGASAAGAAAYAREKTHEKTGTDPVSVLPQSAQKTVDQYTNPAQNTSDAVPSEVKESQKEAHVAPEASANPEAVHEKSDVEKELLQKVPQSQAAGEPAPVAAAETSAAAPAPTTATTAAPAATSSSSGAPQLADPTAGVAALSMDDKPKDGLNAAAGSSAQTPGTKTSELAAEKPLDSRDVSPMTKQPTTASQTQPQVTSGVASSDTAAQSKPVGTPRTGNGAPSTPQKRNSIMDRFKGTQGTPDSQKTAETSGSGKKKGFFSKLKEKLKQ